MNSVTEAIIAEAQLYTVTRVGVGTRDKGVYTPGVSSTVQVLMAVQPMGPREAQLQPEGIRNREPLKCYATSELRPADQVTGAGGDRFAHLGRLFEVVGVSDYSAAGGYWRAVAARVQG